MNFVRIFRYTGIFLLVLSIPGVFVRLRGEAAPEASEWIDISVGVVPGDTPVYPGDPPATFTWARSIPKGDVVNLTDLHFGAHTGTHIDAPLHFINGGPSIDQIPLGKLIGPARVIECSPRATLIDLTELNRHNWRGAKRLLFKTRNSYQNFWGDKDFHRDFTALGPDAAQALIQSGVELVGIDYLSVEKFGSKEPLVHRTLLGKNVVVVEGLDLRQVPAGEYDLICLPAKFVGREAAPTRAVLHPRKAS